VHSPDSASLPDPADTPAEAARQIIAAVIGRYNQQLLAARRLGDQQRQDEIDTHLQACFKDQSQLAEAEPKEVTRLTTLYADHLEALEAGEQ
jgi:hypothetical protein